VRILITDSNETNVSCMRKQDAFDPETDIVNGRY
jgi:hypothetical protein